jgi:hypothetical protein
VTAAERSAKRRQDATDVADVILAAAARGELDREFCVQALLNYGAIERNTHFDEIVARLQGTE